jgi:hypothetical protein
MPEVPRKAGFIDAGFLQSFLIAAEDVGAYAIARGNGLATCFALAAADAATCTRAQIGALAERIFRRPIAADEVSRYAQMFDSLAGSVGKPKAGQAVITALVTSPYFLYRIESATAARPQLSGYDLASRLSFSLWDSVPDDVLLAAARDGKLTTRDAVLAQAERMVASPKARRLTNGFFAALVPFEETGTTVRDAKLFPGTSTALFKDMVTETHTFLEKVVWDDGGTVADLLSAPYSYLNAPLATFYGAPAPTGPAASQFTRVTLPPAQRAGLLTHASFLTALAHPDEAAPVLRAAFVTKRLLCNVLPPPPPDVGQPDPPSPKLSQRQRYAAHSSVAVCHACHQLFDSIGFGLENYDAVGRYVTSENGFPVTGDGQVPALDGQPVAFKGGVELARALAKSPQLRRCLERQLVEYMTDAVPGTDATRLLDAIDGRLGAEGYKLARLPIAVVASPAFLATRSNAGGAP